MPLKRGDSSILNFGPSKPLSRPEKIIEGLAGPMAISFQRINFKQRQSGLIPGSARQRWSGLLSIVFDQ